MITVAKIAMAAGAAQAQMLPKSAAGSFVDHLVTHVLPTLFRSRMADSPNETPINPRPSGFQNSRAKATVYMTNTTIRFNLSIPPIRLGIEDATAWAPCVIPRTKWSSVGTSFMQYTAAASRCKAFCPFGYRCVMAAVGVDVQGPRARPTVFSFPVRGKCKLLCNSISQVCNNLRKMTPPERLTVA